MAQRVPDQRGSALIFAMGFMVVVLVIALGVHTLVGGQLQASGNLRQRVSAEYLGQGGVARALAWFNDQAYQLPRAASLTATVPVTLVANDTAVVLPSNHPNSYTDVLGQSRGGVVTSYNSYLTSQTSSGGIYSVVASLMATQPELWELLATAQQGTVQRQVGALLIRQQEPLFGDALFGRDSATMVGNAYTDSYDSSLGAYGGANKFQTGNVHSNGNISLNGNATVKGDAIPGPNMAVNLTGNAAVTGLTTPAPVPKLLPPITIPSDAVTLDEISLNGNDTQTLTAGTYRVTSISITGNAQLIINNSAGPVNLFVTGSISVAGNGISNASGKPQDLSISQVGGASVSFSGNGNFFGTVYAPDSSLAVSGNGELYGGFVGASISVNGNAGIHYDQSLRTIPGPPGPLRLVAQWTLPS